MIISVLFVDCTVPSPDDGFYVMSECELLGSAGSYYISSNGAEIPISDEALADKRKNIEPSIFGNVEWFVILRIGQMDESNPDAYKPTGLNLNDFKS